MSPDRSGLMGLSLRQVRRLRAAYRKEGVAALAHGNRGRRPVHALSDETRRRVVALATGGYAGCTHHHLQELLAEREGVVVSCSSCWTLWHHNIPALGLPGASTWKPEYAALVAGLTVFVWREPGTGGDTFVNAVISDLPNVRVIEAPRDAKDASQLFLLGPEAFKGRMETLMRAARPAPELQAEALSAEARKLYEKGQPVLKDPAILHRLILASESLGHTDDRRNVAALHLSVVSRLLPRPVSVLVKGPSAGGKSHLVHSVLGIHPETAAYVLSAMSERALAYSTEPLAHRFLVLEEAASLDKKFATFLVRSLLSEGRIRYETVEKTDKGLAPRLIEREGPTGFIATTTAHSLDAETETRVLTLEVAESPDHLRHALRAIATRRDGEATPAVPVELVAALRWLEMARSREVEIPFAAWLAERLPVDGVATRLTRDFQALLTSIGASAILHQRQRARDASGQIVATVADYAIAVATIGSAFELAGNDALTERQREAVEVVRAICQDDGNGFRVKKTEGGQTILYVNKFYEKNLATGVVTVYYYLGDKRVAYKEGTALRYIHQDHLTGTSVISDTSGSSVGTIKYKPYGEARSSSGTLPAQKFTGQRLDGTGGDSGDMTSSCRAVQRVGRNG